MKTFNSNSDQNMSDFSSQPTMISLDDYRKKSNGLKSLPITAADAGRLRVSGCAWHDFGLSLSKLVAQGEPPSLIVTGPRGSPGITETALGLAWLLSRWRPFLLQEQDLDGLSLGLRLGFPPADAVHPYQLQWVERLGVMYQTPQAFSLRNRNHQPPSGGSSYQERGLDWESNQLTPGWAPLSGPEVAGTVIDAGPGQVGTGNDQMVVVMEPSPVGLVRGAELLSRWTGRQPFLVVNRLTHSSQVTAIRMATGLEPIALVPQTETPQIGDPPLPALLSALQPALDRIRGALFSGRLNSFPKCGCPSESRGRVRISSRPPSVRGGE